MEESLKEFISRAWKTSICWVVPQKGEKLLATFSSGDISLRMCKKQLKALEKRLSREIEIKTKDPQWFVNCHKYE